MISIRTWPLSWRNLQTAFHRRRSGSRYTVQQGSRGSGPGHHSRFQWPNGAAEVATRALGSKACRREGRRRLSAVGCRTRRDGTVHARLPILARREIILSANAARQYVDVKTRQRRGPAAPIMKKGGPPYKTGAHEARSPAKRSP